MSSKNNACPGIDSPASVRALPSTTLRNSGSVIRWRPTSISVPTTALTMLRRKRLALISKYHEHGDTWCQAADLTSQSVVLTSELLLQKAPKSLYSVSMAAARFINSKSRS